MCPPRERGFVLIATLLILFVVGLMSVFFLKKSNSAVQFAALFRRKVGTDERAEGELKLAMKRLNGLLMEKGFTHPTYGNYRDTNYTSHPGFATAWQFLFEESATSATQGGYLARILFQPMEYSTPFISGNRTTVEFLPEYGADPANYRCDGIHRPVRDVNHDGDPDDVYEVTLQVTTSDRTGVRTVLKQELLLGAVVSPIFNYAMLAKRVKECQFCHSDIRGQIGQVSRNFSSPISYHGLDTKFGMYLTPGEFRLYDHPGSPSRVVTPGVRTMIQGILSQGYTLDVPTAIGDPWNGPIVGSIRENVTDPSVLPHDWPSLLQRVNGNGDPVATDPTSYPPNNYPINELIVQNLDGNGSVTVTGAVDPVTGLATNRIWHHGPLGPQVNAPDATTLSTDASSPLLGGYNGDVVIDGSRGATIQVCGNVFIKGDLIIKGQVKTVGCPGGDTGTIYVGRNIYIAGDLTYANPPPGVGNASVYNAADKNWWCPTSLAATETPTTRYDMLGLFAGGNVIIGSPAASRDALYYRWLNYESSGVVPNPDNTSDPRGTMNFIEHGVFTGVDVNHDGKVSYPVDMATGFYVLDGKQGKRPQNIFAPYPDTAPGNWANNFENAVGESWDFHPAKPFYKQDMMINTTGLLPTGAQLQWRVDPLPATIPDKASPGGWVEGNVWNPSTGWISPYQMLKLSTRYTGTGIDATTLNGYPANDSLFRHDTGYTTDGGAEPAAPSPDANLPNANNIARYGVGNNVTRVEAFVYTDGAVVGHKNSAEGLNHYYCSGFNPTVSGLLPNLKSVERYGFTTTSSCKAFAGSSLSVDCMNLVPAFTHRRRGKSAWSEGGQDNAGEILFNGFSEVGDAPEGCGFAASPDEPDGLTIVGGVVARDIDIFTPGGLFVCYDDRLKDRSRIKPLLGGAFTFPEERYLVMGQRK